MNKGVSVSMQSVNSQTLVEIKRSNIKLKELNETDINSNNYQLIKDNYTIFKKRINQEHHFFGFIKVIAIQFSIIDLFSYLIVPDAKWLNRQHMGYVY